MSEYTVHVQVPDAAIGAVLHNVVLDFHDVSCSSLRSGNGTWLSFGINAEEDNDAVMLASSVRYFVGQVKNVTMPAGYHVESLRSFESAPMIITCGRVVIHSEGI